MVPVPDAEPTVKVKVSSTSSSVSSTVAVVTVKLSTPAGTVISPVTEL